MLVDDHTVLRDSLKAYLALYPDLEVVGEAADGIEALSKVRQLHPDILLLDLAMPGLGGVDVLRRIRKDAPECKVVVLTQHELPEYILPALREGAKGYILKRAGGNEVVQAIRAVAQGESYLHPAITSFIIEAALRPDIPSRTGDSAEDLTEREREVLVLIGEGKTNAEIAANLNLSAKTVSNYISSVLLKVHATDRAKLMLMALEAGMGQKTTGSE